MLSLATSADAATTTRMPFRMGALFVSGCTAIPRVRATDLDGALKLLPDAQRQVLVLAYFGGLSQSQIAEPLALPLGTVKKRIRLGMGKLRGALAPRGLSEDPPGVRRTAE